MLLYKFQLSFWMDGLILLFNKGGVIEFKLLDNTGEDDVEIDAVKDDEVDIDVFDPSHFFTSVKLELLLFVVYWLFVVSDTEVEVGVMNKDDDVSSSFCLADVIVMRAECPTIWLVLLLK